MPILDPTSFTTPREKLELLAYMGTQKRVQSRGSVRKYVAKALTDSIPLSLANLMSGQFEASPDNKISRYVLRAKIQSALYRHKDPHAMLPDPCLPIYASKPNEAIALIKLHSLCITPTSFDLSDAGQINKGDIIEISCKIDRQTGQPMVGLTTVTKIIQRAPPITASDAQPCIDLAGKFDYTSVSLGASGAGDPGTFSWSNRKAQYSITWADTGATLLNGEIEGSGLLVKDNTSGAQLVKPAMEDFLKLTAAFAKKFPGETLKGSGYRTYAGQVEQRMLRVAGDVKCSTGNGEGSGQLNASCENIGYAAIPGHSGHGWGAAVDLDRGPWEGGKSGPSGNRGKAKQFIWINKFSTDYNFVFGVNGEHWHIDWMPYGKYVGGGVATPQTRWASSSSKGTSALAALDLTESIAMTKE